MVTPEVAKVRETRAASRSLREQLNQELDELERMQGEQLGRVREAADKLAEGSAAGVSPRAARRRKRRFWLWII